MRRLFPQLLCRLIAAFLLVLDLSQEPSSALPAPADGDGNAVNEITRREDFWWYGPAASGHELNMALAAEYFCARPDQFLPEPPAKRIARATINAPAVTIPVAPYRQLFLAAIGPPVSIERPSATSVRSMAACAETHRNTYLGHRASVLLLI